MSNSGTLRPLEEWAISGAWEDGVSAPQNSLQANLTVLPQSRPEELASPSMVHTSSGWVSGRLVCPGGRAEQVMDSVDWICGGFAVITAQRR